MPEACRPVLYAHEEGQLVGAGIQVLPQQRVPLSLPGERLEVHAEGVRQLCRLIHTPGMRQALTSRDVDTRKASSISFQNVCHPPLQNLQLPGVLQQGHCSHLKLATAQPRPWDMRTRLLL